MLASRHVRGVKKVDAYFPIQRFWDTGAPGTTTTSDEYLDYMDLRRRLGCTEVEARKRWDDRNTRLRIMNAKNDDLPDDPNAQSIVMKVEHRNMANDITHSSVMLCGDTDAVAWKDIMTHYDADEFSSSLLLGSHHGSITFFDDPSDEKYYYTAQVKAISPEMVDSLSRR